MVRRRRQRASQGLATACAISAPKPGAARTPKNTPKTTGRAAAASSPRSLPNPSVARAASWVGSDLEVVEQDLPLGVELHHLVEEVADLDAKAEPTLGPLGG